MMTPTHARTRPRRCPRSFGFTLIELLIGLSVALVVLTGALTVAGLQLGEHHRLMLELQVQQELRATAELMLRDLRRAGGWDRPQDGVWRTDQPLSLVNPFGELSLDEGGRRISYSFSKGDGSAPASPGAPATASLRETSGFRLVDGRLDQLIAGRHQPLTDSAIVRVTGFRVVPMAVDHPLTGFCARPCPAGLSPAGACPPVLRVHALQLSLEAEAAHDTRVRHQLRLHTRLRNDQLLGACP